jgi:biopolymer transport protein ExbD
MRIRRESENNSEIINISSLLDVMFILIIFFLATTTFQREERDVRVNLPEAAAGATLSEAPRVIVINVLEDGQYRVGLESMTLAQVRATLVAAIEEKPDHRVLVRGDRSARHGHVADAVLAARQAGVEQAHIGYQLVQ